MIIFGKRFLSEYKYIFKQQNNKLLIADIHPNRSIRINSSQTTKSADSAATDHHNFVPLTSDNLSDKLSTHMNLSILILTIIVSVMIFIGLCVGVAAVVARCQKRGNFSQLDQGSVEFTKLVVDR